MNITYPDFIIIPRQIMIDKTIEPIGEKLYGVIYWYCHLKMEKCFASNVNLAKILETSPRTIQNALDALEKSGHIKRVYKDKARRHRMEIIAMVSFKNQSATTVTPESQTEMAVTPERNHGDTIERNGGDHKSNKGIVRSKSKTLAPQAAREVNEFIELFKNVNPSYERLYSNKTQRAALDRMIKKHGPEKVKKAIEYAGTIYGRPMAPVICTPLQLEAGLGKMVAYYQREQKQGPKMVTI